MEIIFMQYLWNAISLFSPVLQFRGPIHKRQNKAALTVIPQMHHKLFHRPGSAMVTPYQPGIKVDQTLWGLKEKQKMDGTPLWEFSFLCFSQGTHTFIFPLTLSLHIPLIPLLILKQPYPRGSSVSSTAGINLALYQSRACLPLIFHPKSSLPNRSIKTFASAIVMLLFHLRNLENVPLLLDLFQVIDGIIWCVFRLMF